MDLFSQFEKRRGNNPPISISPAVEKPPELDSRQVLELAFVGQLKRSYRLPVLPPYQVILGESVWLCPDEDKARCKQRTDNNLLAFHPGELMDICLLASEDHQQIVVLVEAKRIFGGSISK